MKKYVAVFLLGFFFSLPILAQENLTGKWLFDVETDMGSGQPTFDLIQDEKGQITGKYQGQLGNADVKGTFIDGKFHLEFTVQGNQVVYDGKWEEGMLKGTVNLANMATGTFEGNRKKE